MILSSSFVFCFCFFVLERGGGIDIAVKVVKRLCIAVKVMW